MGNANVVNASALQVGKGRSATVWTGITHASHLLVMVPFVLVMVTAIVGSANVIMVITSTLESIVRNVLHAQGGGKNSLTIPSSQVDDMKIT